MADINLSPYTAESEAIARRLRMAELLGQQANLPMEMPTQAGVKISPYAGLAKMLQGFTSGLAQKRAEQESKDLADRFRAQNQGNLNQFMETLYGAPERAPQLDVQETQQMADQGTPMPPNIPAVAPDSKKALMLALSANPQQQGFMLPIASGQLAKEEEAKNFQNILKTAGMNNQPQSVQPLPSPQNTVQGQPTGQVQGAPLNNLNPNVLAMSGNPKAMELAKFIQTNQPEFGTKSEVFQKPDGTLFERVLGKRGEVIERPLAGTPYEKEPEANKSVTSAIVAAGIDPKSLEGKKIYRELVAKQTSHPPAASIKNDIKLGESIAGQVGPMMKDSVAIAEGAVRQVDAANRVIQAVNTGKLTAGPFAGARVTASQLGQVLGVGGKDAAEQLANTRQVIRGLAEMTLQGRSQMKGQGAITESEGLLAEKANSGRIEDLTIPEIKQLAIASERAARFAYAEHQRKLQEMIKNPATTAIAPYYQGPAMPDPISQDIQPVLVDGNPPPGAVRRVR